MLTYFFPTKEGLCLPPCKGKKKGKKAKKKAKGYADEAEREFGEDARSIQEATASGGENGGKSICNPANLPGNGDIDLLKNIIELSEEAAKNVEDRSFINDLYNKYVDSIDFNTTYKDELINKEGKYYTFTFGEDYYTTLADTRNVNFINKSNNPEYRDEVIDEIQKQIYVNQELDKNKLALEKTLDDLQTKRDEVLRETNEIENGIYVYNRDSAYETDKYDYTTEVTYVVSIVYFVFLLLYAYLRLSQSNIVIYKEIAILLVLVFLPNKIYDTSLVLIQKLGRFFQQFSKIILN